MVDIQTQAELVIIDVLQINLKIFWTLKFSIKQSITHVSHLRFWHLIARLGHIECSLLVYSS